MRCLLFNPLPDGFTRRNNLYKFMYLTAVCRSGLIQQRIAKQTIKIMKLTTVLLITACLQLSATGFTQKVTI